jgi:hypothetical protein
MTSTAEHLMRLASEAEDKATDYMTRASEAGRTLEAHLAGYPGDAVRRTIHDCEERAYFYQGQASGFRQSAYYAAILEGTNAND